MGGIWYGRYQFLAWGLLPLSLVFWLGMTTRQLLYRIGWFKTVHFSAPVIVVGNITAGGTGKTPLTIWLAQHLKTRGFRPGIVSRGYGGKARHWPQQVRPDSDPNVVGDEAILLAGRSGCPMCISPKRADAVNALLEHTDCNIVISDDGLQHYAMSRNLEIAVIDGSRGFGNGFLLPAGPLREKPSRLSSVELVISNGLWRDDVFSMRLQNPALLPLEGNQQLQSLESFAGVKVHAIAGLGNPQRFFKLLTDAGLEVIPHPFKDHKKYKPKDLKFTDNLPILMTEKDAVKCRHFHLQNIWVVGISLQPEEKFIHQLDTLLDDL